MAEGACCQWKSWLVPQYHCRVPAQPDSSLCILHLRGKKDIKRFNDAIREQIKGTGDRDRRNPRFSFRGYWFPKDVAVSTDSDNVSSEDVILPRSIPEDIDFSESKIVGNADFRDAHIEGTAEFRLARISGHTNFRGARISGSADFTRTQMNREATFRRVEIGGNADFSHAKIGGDADFNGAEIMGNASFASAKFSRHAVFNRAKMRGDLRFNNAETGGHADFRSAEIGGGRVVGDADFSWSVWGKNLILEGSFFHGDADFTMCSATGLSLGKGKPALPPAAGRRGLTLRSCTGAASFWQFAAETFAKMGERSKADAAFYFQRVAGRREAFVSAQGPLHKSFAAVLYVADLIFFRLPIGYGTSYSRTLASWAVVTLGFAAFYALAPSTLGRHVPSVWSFSNWRTALRASLSVFTKLGDSGIGQATALGRTFLFTEAVLGAVLIALTVVVVSRKVMR